MLPTFNIDAKPKAGTSALVVFSGGQDSTTCLIEALHHYETVEAISFAYGQRHALELTCAAQICEALKVPHTVLDMSLLNQLAPNALTRLDIPVDAAPQTQSQSPSATQSASQSASQSTSQAPSLPNTFVDGRNLLFLSFAAVYAKQKGISDIICGVSESDYSGYPDCRDIFIKSLNVTLNLAMDYQFNLISPLMWRDKAAVWALADHYGALDFIRQHTLTCYNGIVGDGCGDCPACHLRSRGLNQYLSARSSR